MKRLLTLFIFTIVLGFSAQAQVKFGAGLQYYASGSNIGIQARSLTSLTDGIKLGVNGAYLFGKSGAFVIDADAVFDLLEINDSAYLSPLAGLSFITNSSTLSINLGAQVRFPIQEREFYVEPKYTAIGVNSFVISAGIFL